MGTSTPIACPTSSDSSQAGAGRGRLSNICALPTPGFDLDAAGSEFVRGQLVIGAESLASIGFICGLISTFLTENSSPSLKRAARICSEGFNIISSGLNLAAGAYEERIPYVVLKRATSCRYVFNFESLGRYACQNPTMDISVGNICYAKLLNANSDLSGAYGTRIHLGADEIDSIGCDTEVGKYPSHAYTTFTMLHGANKIHQKELQ